MTKFCSLHESIADIDNSATIATVGVIGWITPDAILKAIADQFNSAGSPNQLTAYVPCGTGDGGYIPGMDHLAKKGLLKRIIAGSYIHGAHPETGKKPHLLNMLYNHEVEGYSWPIAASMHWLREVARKSPGYLTKTGIGTYVDPDVDGGKFTNCCEEDLVEKIKFKGEDYLFYPTFDLDFGIIRATSADSNGNLSFENEALLSSNIAIAIAVKACGGQVIAQVEKKVELGTRAVGDVKLPGIFVDKIVVVEDQRFVTGIDRVDPHFLGLKRQPVNELPKAKAGISKIIAARAAQEVRKHELSIFGFGASGDIPIVMAEQGLFDDDQLYDYCFTTEHGPYGGVVMPGWVFSANVNPEALLDGISQFDVIEGGLCKFCSLSFAEFDQRGSVNVSQFGKSYPGSGGFVNIAHNAERIIFTGSFTTVGLRTSVKDGKLNITTDGKIHKFVEQVQSITYLVQEGVTKRNQDITVVTERAVFKVKEGGLCLIEIAPGVDLEKDILRQMDFKPVEILDPLPLMDPSFFIEEYVE